MSIVQEFHEAFDLPRPKQPDPVDVDMLRLRLRLISEEYKEVRVEILKLIALLQHARPGAERVDAVMATLGDLLKELADLRYVTEGAAVSFGLPIDAAYAEVHRSNMSKLGADGKPLYRDDGKVLKGPNYTEADMTQFVPAIIDSTAEEA